MTFSRLRFQLIAVVLSGTIALLCVGYRVHSQEAASTPVSKVERKNKAPLSGDVLRVNLPKPLETKLANGLTVLIVEDHRFPTVTVQLQINGAGALFENANLPGLASVTAQMLREGTNSRSSKQIAEAADRLGANFGASADFGSAVTTFSASGLRDNFSSWFELATDVLLHPSFPADELEKLKQRLRVQLRQQRSSANFLLAERFNRAVYGSHPAAKVSLTTDSIEAITPEILAKWHGERYVPQNAILGFAGDVRAAELISFLQKTLGRWQPTALKEILPPNPAPSTERRIFLVDRPNSVQTSVALGNIAIDRRSPDYVPMVVMNHLLGGGPAARLFLNLREEKGYTYGVYSDFTAIRYPGPWRAGGDMRTEVTGDAMVEFLKEIRRIRDEKVSDRELADTKRAITARFALSLEQPTGVLGFAMVRKTYGFPPDYWDTYPAKVMAVTAEDVQRIARKYLDPETMQIVAVGDAQKIKPALQKYGSVQLYDSNGAAAPL
jgi:zinc protease